MSRPYVSSWIVVSLLTLTSNGHAAFENLPVGGRTAGLAGVSSVGVYGPEAVFGNPALLGSMNSPACLFDASRLFGLAALNRSAFAAAFKAVGCGIGLGFQTFGSSLYRENTAAVSAGLLFWKVSLGMSVRALELSIARYGEARTWTMDAGIGLRLSGNMDFGASASNLLDARFGVDRNHVPRIVRLGFAFSWKSDAVLCVEAVKEGGFPLDLRSGFELRVRPIDLRVGIVTSPSLWTWGFGVRLGPIRVDFADSEHPTLGSTRQVSLVLGKTRR